MVQPMRLRVTVMQSLLVAAWAKYAVRLTLSRRRKLHITFSLMAKLSFTNSETREMLSSFWELSQ